MDHRCNEQDHQAVVRNGYLPEQEVQTGSGAIGVQVLRVRDRSQSGIRFHSGMLPPYLRRSKSIEALASLLGPDAPGLSPTPISRLTQIGTEELCQWQQRDVSATCYVYFWVDADDGIDGAKQHRGGRDMGQLLDLST